MAQQIKCSVDQCVFNAMERCEASSIEVSACGCQDVKHASETACKTFRDRKEQRRA
ncbi:MAG: DUF1540 domain-containing protein [Bacillota bacterium]|nr:DUF1540 domain-containing protein [Bacillota bacterium]